MRHRAGLTAGITVAIFAALLSADAPRARQRTAEHWVGTWATALVARASQPAASASQQGAPAPQAPPRFANQTLRQIVRVTLGGDNVRVVLSNAFGTSPLQVGAAHVALRQTGA